MKSILIEKPNQLAIVEREIPSWLGNTPHTGDSLLPRSIVSMLTSFPLNAGVAEQKPAA